MSFFKRLFGIGSNEPQARKLSHPRDIRTGDIIKFKFHDISDISGQTFEVSKINTYIYDGEWCYPEILLKDTSGNILFMMYEEEDGEEYITLSKKVAKAQLHDIISENDVTAIVHGSYGTSVQLQNKPAELADWLADEYTLVDTDVTGSFVKGDARYLSDAELDRQEDFTSQLLEDDEGEKALEFEMYGTGEKELSVSVYLDINDIEEMWPAEQA